MLFTAKKHGPARYPKSKLPMFPVFIKLQSSFFLTCIQVPYGIFGLGVSNHIFEVKPLSQDVS